MSFLGCIFRFQVNVMDITYSLLPIYIVKYISLPLPLNFSPILTLPFKTSTVEVDIGIICTCLPLLGALFKENTKESRQPTGFRSIHNHLPSSRSRFPRSVDRKHQNHNSDNIELIPQTSAAGVVPETYPVSPPSSSPNAIWRITTIEQKWGESSVPQQWISGSTPVLSYLICTKVLYNWNSPRTTPYTPILWQLTSVLGFLLGDSYRAHENGVVAKSMVL